MESNTEKVVPNYYNPNQIVTYMVIDSEPNEPDITNWYPTIKVSDLEWELNQYRITKKRLNEYSSKVTQLEEKLSDYLDMDSEEIVVDICSIFGFNPTKEVEFEATATITGIITVPLSEFADFDIDSVDFNIDVSSYSHDVEINDTEVGHITTL